MNVPAVFSDYCEEACHLAAHCTNTVAGISFSLPVCPISLCSFWKAYFQQHKLKPVAIDASAACRSN